MYAENGWLRSKTKNIIQDISKNLLFLIDGTKFWLISRPEQV